MFSQRNNPYCELLSKLFGESKKNKRILQELITESGVFCFKIIR